MKLYVLKRSHYGENEIYGIYNTEAAAKAAFLSVNGAGHFWVVTMELNQGGYKEKFIDMSYFKNKKEK